MSKSKDSEIFSKFINNIGESITKSYVDIFSDEPDDGCICYDDGQTIDYKSNCTIHGKAHKSDTWINPEGGFGKQNLDRRPTDLDPAKKFQCEMAERIFYRLNNENKNQEYIGENVRTAKNITLDIYKHFFK